MNIKNNNMQNDIFNDIHDYEKKYDPWEKMKFITYLLFFTDIIYTIIIVIYLVLTGKISEC